ncbi:MAG: hypothetical protein LBK99_21330, partial [Opitutaceae bacterium]|nr:hypothetical protein [Opitutaceae bacterium]
MTIKNNKGTEEETTDQGKRRTVQTQAQTRGKAGECAGGDGQVKQMLLGIDLHKETAVVTMQPGESPAQPAQRLSTRALVGWVEK